MNRVPHSRPWLTPAEHTIVGEVLGSHWLGAGERTAEFEHAFARWVGAQRAVAVGSGSAAILLAITALDCGAGDEIILPSYVCRCVLQAVVASGATPVLCDVGDDWLMEPRQAENVLTRRTRAIIIPHLYGFWADIAAFRRFDVPLIEDCAQTLGSSSATTILGDYAIYSFHPTKCLTTGEGGMVVARKAADTEKLFELRDGARHAARRRIFSPLPDLSSALGLVQLARYPEALRIRSEIAARYHRELGPAAAQLAPWIERRASMNFRFPLRLPGGVESVQHHADRFGVTVRSGVDELLHRLLDRPDTDFPRSTRHLRETISIPIHPSLAEDEINRVAAFVAAVATDA